LTRWLAEGAGFMTVSVEIDPRWVRIVRSPVYVVVSALTGVSISFAPLFLYWSGKGKFFPGYEWFVVPLCFAVIYLVPAFYFVLGGMVARKLRAG
jgi:hypothetical protein